MVNYYLLSTRVAAHLLTTQKLRRAKLTWPEFVNRSHSVNNGTKFCGVTFGVFAIWLPNVLCKPHLINVELQLGI